MKKNTEDKKKSEEKNIPATVNPSGVPEKKQKKQEEKNLPVKNLPRLFRKKYTEKKFKKKILKKLYIDKDKTYVQSLFADVPGTGKQQRVAVPADTLFTKSEVSRLKTLAQQIAIGCLCRRCCSDNQLCHFVQRYSDKKRNKVRIRIRFRSPVRYCVCPSWNFRL